MKARDESEYVAYVTARLPSLRRVAAQLAGDAHRGDDLVQQTITKLYTHWRRATRADNLDGYVYRILVRALLDEKRLGWAAVRLGVEPADRPDPPPVTSRTGCCCTRRSRSFRCGSAPRSYCATWPTYRSARWPRSSGCRRGR